MVKIFDGLNPNVQITTGLGQITTKVWLRFPPNVLSISLAPTIAVVSGHNKKYGKTIGVYGKPGNLCGVERLCDVTLLKSIHGCHIHYIKEYQLYNNFYSTWDLLDRWLVLRSDHSNTEILIFRTFNVVIL